MKHNLLADVLVASENQKGKLLVASSAFIISMISEVAALYSLGSIFSPSNSRGFTVLFFRFGFFTLFSTLCTWVANSAFFRSQIVLEAQLKQEFISQIIGAPWRKLSKLEGGQIHNVIASESNQVALLVVTFFKSLSNLFGSIFIALAVIIQKPGPGMVAGSLGLIVSIIYRMQTRGYKDIQARLRRDGADLNQSSIILVRGLKTMKLSHVEQKWIKTINHNVEKLKKSRALDLLTPINARFIGDFFVLLVALSFLYSGGYKNFVSSMVAFGILMRVVPKIQTGQQQLRYVIDGRNWIETWFRRSSEIGSDIEPLNESSVGFEICHGDSPSVVVKDLSFAYDDEDGKVLENCALSLLHGDWLLIQASSGRGKSTFVEILAGLHAFDTGSVEICNVNIGKMKISNLIVVPQESELVGSTLDEILTWGAIFNNSVGDMELVKRICGINEMFINIKREVDLDAGNDLSSGMRARLAIARALLLDPHILVFDEVTTRLDATSEKKMFELIKSEFPYLTLIAISHRKENLEFFNKTLEF